MLCPVQIGRCSWISSLSSIFPLHSSSLCITSILRNPRVSLFPVSICSYGFKTKTNAKSEITYYIEGIVHGRLSPYASTYNLCRRRLRIRVSDARGEVWVRTKVVRLSKTCIQKNQLDGPQRLGIVVACDKGQIYKGRSRN